MDMFLFLLGGAICIWGLVAAIWLFNLSGSRHFWRGEAKTARSALRAEQINVKALREENGSLRDSKKVLGERIDELREEVARKDDEIVELTFRPTVELHERIEASLSECQGKCKELRAEVKRLENVEANLREKVVDVPDAVLSLTRDRNQWEAKAKKYARRIGGYVKGENWKEKRIEELEKELKEVKEARDAWQAKSDGLSKRILGHVSVEEELEEVKELLGNSYSKGDLAKWLEKRRKEG